jgi:hypothetical protein
MGYFNMIELLVRAPDLIAELTSNTNLRRSFIRQPYLLFDHIRDNFADLVNDTQYEYVYDTTNPLFQSLSDIPHLRRALFYNDPMSESTKHTCEQIANNNDLRKIISLNESLQQYFIYNLDELEAALAFYANVSLPPTVTSSFSSSSSSSDIVTHAQFTLTPSSHSLTPVQTQDRQSHQRSLDMLYRLIVVNYGTTVLEAIIADVLLMRELHDNPMHALTFSLELYQYAGFRNLPVVSRHDHANYVHRLSGTPVLTSHPLLLPLDRVPNDITHQQHLHNLNRELNMHLSFNEIHHLLDIPTVQRLHDDVTYVDFLCNIANARRTLASRIPNHYPSTREPLSHNIQSVDDNYTPVSTKPRALKRLMGHQKNAFASSATSSTASTQRARLSSRAVPAPDIVTSVRPPVNSRAVKSRPAMSRTREREWQLFRRYDLYTNTRTLANQPYNTYYTWLSSYNADDYSSDEIVDNDTNTDEEVESDDNDDVSVAPPSRVIPVIPPPNPLVASPVHVNNLDTLVNMSVARARHSYIDLTLRNNLTVPSIHSRVFHDYMSPPAHNTRAQQSHHKPKPSPSPSPPNAKPSGQPSLFPTR